MRHRFGLQRLAFVCIVLILVLVMLYSGLRILESTVFYQPGTEAVQTESGSKTILRDGIAYFPRQDITVLMLLGIDQTGLMEDSGSYNNPGACDVVMLAVFDETNREYSILYLNRDTMMDIPVLGIGGKRAGTIHAQLALAHSYGSGLNDSCENVKTAVSDFLYGLYIDHYLSMNMDAIGILNDAVGGVTVNITDDFSAVDPDMKTGTMTLDSRQAVTFLRSRGGVGDQLNLSRIERQKEYMENFAEALNEKAAADDAFLLEAYEAISPYSVTDCTAAALTSMAERFGEYDLKQITAPAGTNVKGETYMEYHVDEEALDELILELFYAPKG